MQLIEVTRQNENGEIIDTLSLNFANILSFVFEKTSNDKFPWLWSVDPYGDTVFNEIQIQNLIKELESLLTLANDSESISSIILFRNYIKEVTSHQYLKLSGD